MGSTAMISGHESMDWVSDKSRYRLGVRGRQKMRLGRANPERHFFAILALLSFAVDEFWRIR
jgi:hypothetical protein